MNTRPRREPVIYPQPTPDFRGDPARVKWTKRVGDSCAYCGALIPEEAVPLHLFRQDGTGARFCDPCAEICFGLIFMEYTREDFERIDG